ncbi:MAG: NADP-dependent malic enzyme [Kordiimonas sp.]|nr:NADP-dependent malic enzyme [Kordiimonas sp.]|tara:strand:+ start:1154 stop:3427 length:2274 start_codon:yes stop_codon:yes gene_type:complete
MENDKLRESALSYHRETPPGKLAIAPTKPLANQRDLSKAYSPGVAFACEEIVKDPREAANVTARGNLVGVVTNGTAVLGLGAIGPLAAKPVMEGKAVLFKKFADIDVFDIELDETDPDKLVDMIAALEPTFGGINLEDIKAPECFVVEKKLRERMNIPVFHDDQHGTAIVAGAAVYNGLRVVNKKIEDVKLVSTGGGAASLACLDLLVGMGLRKENIYLVDRVGVVYEGREEDNNSYKSRYAQNTPLRTLDDVIDGADIFLGLSGPDVLSPSMVKKMASQPLILAMANPTPEILPEVALEARPDAILATGRSDYPNQVNNVLCFPFIFRGALDVGATTINEEMKIACVEAIADLAYQELDETVANAYSGQELKFGPQYLIPKPFDPRLISVIAPAVAKAAMDSGVASRPLEDFDAYRAKLNQLNIRSQLLMQPIFNSIKGSQKRLVYAEGEDVRVLRAVQAVIDEGVARPILIGRPDVVQHRIDSLGLRLEMGRDFDLTNPENDPRYKDYWQELHNLVGRKGVSAEAAKTIIRTNTTAIASVMLRRGEADAMICGSYGRFDFHLRYIMDILGRKTKGKNISSLSVLLLPKGPLFLSDAFIGIEPTVDHIIETTLASIKQVQKFGITPKVALLSHSNFGTSKAPSARKMREATTQLRNMQLGVELDGEMHADAALDASIRAAIYPMSDLTGQANLLIMPNLDAANIALELVKSIDDALFIGPVLQGVGYPAHIVTPAVSARGIFNMSALAVIDAMQSS